MFYGLNKFIKNILPKRLFYRALLIVAIPVIVIQLIITSTDLSLSILINFPIEFLEKVLPG